MNRKPHRHCWPLWHDHVKAGLAVESDRMSAQVNVAERKQELIVAQGDLDLAWAQLREAMGTPDLKASELKPIEPHTFAQLPLEDELATASKTRPDLTALTQAQSAQASGLKAAKSNFGPVVNTYGNWEEDRRSLGSSGGNNWVAGVQISIDILPLGKRAQLAQQTAAKQKIDAQLSASQQHVRLEVSQAHIHRRTAQLSLDTAQAALDQSRREPSHPQEPLRRGTCQHHRSAADRGCRETESIELLACSIRKCHGLC